MSAFILILTYILAVCEAVWYFTSTEHEEIPLIVSLFDCFLCCIPGINCIIVLANILISWILVNEGDIELKDNWFNRTFLAYRGE